MKAYARLRGLSAGLSQFVPDSLRIVALIALALSLVACRAVGDHTVGDTAVAPERTLILISIDGLPASVPGSGAMPALDRMAANGVRAMWMTPSFPTLTFPNHYTLVTGRRPDRHGIVHNDMFDPTLGEFHSKEDSAKDSRWWSGEPLWIEPIWISLRKQGGIAATMFWPGSEVAFDGLRPHFYRPFDRGLSPNARVDQALAWLDLPPQQRPRFVTLYFEQFDVAAHETGLDSADARAAQRTIDAALTRLQTGLRKRGLTPSTDLIVVSDHGMADVARDRFSLLDDRLAPDAYRVVWWGQVIGLEPMPGRVAEVERAFLGRQAHYNCWRKTELPKQWHFGTHPRIPSVVCQADPGWRVLTAKNRRQPQPIKAEHGFAADDPSMRAMFVASGPSFKAGAVIAPFDNVDLYPLLAHLLRVQPQDNDGKLESTAEALR